jgi:hypothetical protein
MLADKARGVELFKDPLGNFRLYGRGRAAEFVKVNIEPAVNIGMYCVVTVAEFPRADSFLGGPGFRSGAVFVGSANIEGFVPFKPAESGKGVGGQDLNKIPQMGHVVHIGER